MFWTLVGAAAAIVGILFGILLILAAGIYGVIGLVIVIVLFAAVAPFDAHKREHRKQMQRARNYSKMPDSLD